MTFPPSGHGVPASGSRARNTNRPREGFDPPDSVARAKVPPQNADAGREAILAKLPELEEGPADRFAPDLLNVILQEYAPDLLLNDGGSSDPIDALSQPSQKLQIYQLGEAWILSFGGKTIALNHTKGMAFLNFLVQNPNLVYSPLDLTFYVTGIRPVSYSTRLTKQEKWELVKQKQEIEKWMEDWEVPEEDEQFAEARKMLNDLERRIRQERDEGTDEFTKTADKIRIAMKVVLKKIKKLHPEAHDFLQKSIKMGAKNTFTSFTDI